MEKAFAPQVLCPVLCHFKRTLRGWSVAREGLENVLGEAAEGAGKGLILQKRVLRGDHIALHSS